MALAGKSKKVRLFDREFAQQAAIREPAWFRSPHHLAWIRTLPSRLPGPSKPTHSSHNATGPAKPPSAGWIRAA